MSTNVSNRSEFTIDRAGSKTWTLNGEYHRLDGPAIIQVDGGEWWFKHDEYHRLDGPAIILPDSRKYWAVAGEQYYSNKEYQEAAKLSDEDMLALILKYGDVR